MRLLSYKLLVMIAAFLAPSAHDPGTLAAPTTIAQTRASHLDGDGFPVDIGRCQFWPDPDQADANNHNGNDDLCVCGNTAILTSSFPSPLCDANYRRCDLQDIE